MDAAAVVLLSRSATKLWSAGSEQLVHDSCCRHHRVVGGRIQVVSQAFQCSLLCSVQLHILRLRLLLLLLLGLLGLLLLFGSSIWSMSARGQAGMEAATLE